MFDNIKADIKRYLKDPDSRKSIYVLFEQGLWAIMVYRFGRWVRTVKVPVVSFLLKIIAFFLFKLMEIVAGVSLPASAVIGKGFYVGHFGYIVLHSNVVIGENCSVVSGVLIGTRGLGNTGTPVIGDNVYIGAGAKILGGIRVGHNVKIGANAVVLTDIPDGATVVGIPGRVLEQK